MGEPQSIEQFYGVYLLYCLNPKYKGRTYIGYTVDPNRRIKQHNKGKEYGGAWKTSNKGPWTMVMIIHGFPNDITALRFEWAWQHPLVSRRLRHIPKKKYRESSFDFCLRVLSEMLKVGPWCRLPLTVRWLNEEFVKDFPVERLPPMHMPICFGSVVSKKLTKSTQEMYDPQTDSKNLCNLCFEIIQGKKMKCLNSHCDLIAHVICLSKYFLKSAKEYIPVEGECPRCEKLYLWGDLVRKMKGCYDNLDVEIDVTLADELYCSDTE